MSLENEWFYESWNYDNLESTPESNPFSVPQDTRSEPGNGTESFLRNDQIDCAALAEFANVVGRDEPLTPQNDLGGQFHLAMEQILAAQAYDSSAFGAVDDHDLDSGIFTRNPLDGLSVSSNASASGPEMESSPHFVHTPYTDHIGHLVSDRSYAGSPVNQSYFGPPSHHPAERFHPMPAYSSGGSYQSFPGHNSMEQSTHVNQSSSHFQPNVAYPTAGQSIAASDGNQDVHQEPQQAPAPEPFVTSLGVPTYSQLMDPIKYNVDIDTVYTSVEDANADLDNDFDPREDPTIPTSVIQQKAIVKAMILAMSSVQHAEDNAGMIKPFAEKKFSLQRMEGVCWNLLDRCIKRHTQGPLLASMGIKPKQSGEMASFAERITKIIDCLATHKTICKHTLDPSYIEQFVDDPIGAEKRVVANKQLNKRKAAVMNAGKASLNIGGKTNSSSANKSTKSIQNQMLEQPVEATSTTYATPTKQTGSLGRTNAPGGVGHNAMNSARPSSSPALSNQGWSPSSQPMVSGASCYWEAPNLVHYNVPTPPSGASRPMAQSCHVRRNTAPTSHPRPNMPFVSANGSPYHARSGSESTHMSPNGMVYAATQQIPSALSTPTKQRCKRPTSEIDDLEQCPSPEKRQR